MARVKERHLEAKYRRFFGRMAGYLPRDRSAVDEYARTLRKEALDKRKKRRAEPPRRDRHRTSRVTRFTGV